MDSIMEKLMLVELLIGFAGEVLVAPKVGR